MAYRIIIEADTKEMAYIIGLNIVDQLGIKPAALQFNDDPLINWDTVEAVQFVRSLPNN